MSHWCQDPFDIVIEPEDRVDAETIAGQLAVVFGQNVGTVRVSREAASYLRKAVLDRVDVERWDQDAAAITHYVAAWGRLAGHLAGSRGLIAVGAAEMAEALDRVVVQKKEREAEQAQAGFGPIPLRPVRVRTA